MTREAAGEAAYAAGEYAAALTEFRALRRMNGGNDFLAAMADCERALGNPDKGLKLVKEGLGAGPDFTTRVELRLVEAGCRMDLDQADEALRVLRHELENGGGKGTRSARVRLRYGYANLLEATGAVLDAERWFAAAAAMDDDGETDAAERVEALQGLVLELDEEALVGQEPEPQEDAEESEAEETGDDEDDEDEDGEDEDAEDDAVEDAEYDPESWADPEASEVFEDVAVAPEDAVVTPESVSGGAEPVASEVFEGIVAEDQDEDEG